MIVYHVKLEHAVTFTKYLPSAFSLIFLTKTLTSNKVSFLASKSSRLEELVFNEPKKTICINIYHNSVSGIRYLVFDLSMLNVESLRVHN